MVELLSELPAVALEGAKGVGKTETAKRLAGTIREMDQPSVQEIATADLTKILSGKPPILIDEWQRVPATWDAVRRAIDKSNQPGQFLLTGSANPSSPPTHTGAGRIVAIRMRPLSLPERSLEKPTVSLGKLLAGEKPQISGETNINLEDYTREIVQSGLPGLRELKGRALRAQLDGYLHRIVDRDFPELGLEVRNPEKLRRWMSAYAAATATSTTFEKIRDAATGGDGVKLAKTTVVPYRDALEKIWMLEEQPAWIPSTNHLKGLTSPPKHHFVDPAFVVQLLGFDEQALLDGRIPGFSIPRDGALLGQLFESLVTQTIRVLGQVHEAKVKHLRTKQGKREIDIILERRDQRVLAIEVKLSSSIRDEDVKHLKWLQSELGEELIGMVVVNTGPMAYRRADGVAVVPAALLGV